MRQDPVPPQKDRCEHGDVVSHALAEVQMEIEGHSIQVQFEVAPNLPMPLLLVTDEVSNAAAVPGLRSSDTASIAW